MDLTIKYLVTLKPDGALFQAFYKDVLVASQVVGDDKDLDSEFFIFCLDVQERLVQKEICGLLIEYSQNIVKSGQKINKNTLYGVIGRKEDKTMMPQTKTCKICGAMMEYQSYASKAADTMFIRFKCPVCKSEVKEIAFLKMLKDNKKILEDLDNLSFEEREFPWPDR